MSSQPFERELELARRLDALEAQATRPVVAGGGLISAIVNGIISRVPVTLIRTAVIVFLGWHAWDYFNQWQQLSAETQKLEAKAAALAADADAKGLNLDDYTLQARKMLTEVAALQADVAKIKAEADKTQAEANAQNQEIGQIKLAVRQKLAEVEEAEAEAQVAIEDAKFRLRNTRALDNSLWKSFESFTRNYYNIFNKLGSELGDAEKK